MNWHIVIDVLRNSVLITGLVLIMMLMIEYFNIHSHGRWFSLIKDSKIKQIFLGSLLGLVPGCIGGFATVSLYTHRLLSLGALVAMMISSSGDEAFVIMAMIPKEGFILFGILFVISIITGIVVDYGIYRKPQEGLCPDDFEIHTSAGENDRKIPSIFRLESYKVMLKPSKERIAILLGIALFIGAVIMGILACGHHHSAEAAHGAETYVCEHGHVHTVADTHNHAVVDKVVADGGKRRFNGRNRARDNQRTREPVYEPDVRARRFHRNIRRDDRAFVRNNRQNPDCAFRVIGLGV